MADGVEIWASAASVASACTRSRVRTTLQGCATLPPNLDRRPWLAVRRSAFGSRFEGDLFADFYPPQTFALRADATLGNERQMVGRSGRARCKRSQRLQTRSRVRTTLQGCATLPPTWTDARLAPSKGTKARTITTPAELSKEVEEASQEEKQ